ncbi:beta-1,3-galactosyltransferase 5 isoform X2 [Contarinia nasturtii]|nr:beta-1,3-galactosyltransferase 5 isoform X2 [Contarinia nasturtii]XP_031619999.1 beta-1,3-galactosyltransferase 5 isoform X2 [Contarinia nasturtii]XP_031620001.1 beta-1,3-galactosyltransferase 5 isoform X2 [Contarinia nasturtii]XP_031620002.1 beta-1,3-galactosyltransferase 5 isoform X2 [Contarinia nasturtii]XP_031620003.1 beta-1,3-galactosyltransferase 5 isoform X2 [Contarinia nasturtii]
MSERRSIFILFIGLMLCISLWISLQDIQELHTEYTSYDPLELLNSVNNSTTSLNLISNTTASSEWAFKNDTTTLIDLKNFEYLINQAPCSDDFKWHGDMNTINKLPIVLVLIHSAPRNWHKRNVIRETWGYKDRRARIFFLLGAVKSTQTQIRLKQENDMFQDLIQGNFFDAYRNMTYKHTMALKWFVYNCPKLKYLIKTDDDVFVNTPAVYDLLEAGFNNENLIFCYRIEDARIKRTYRSKWRVSTKEFSGRYYPNYCPGFSIIYSSDVVLRLYKEAQQTPYFWIDDVHITGTLAQHLNLNITTLGKYYLNSIQLNDLITDKLHLSSIEPMFLFAEPNIHEEQIRALWNTVNNSYR